MGAIKGVIHTRKQKGRNDSVFYYGKHIATITNGIETLFVESQGEIEMSLAENGKTYANKDLLKQLQKRRFTDKELKKCSNYVNMGNWFVIRNTNETICDITTTQYTHAIQRAKDLLK